MTEALAVWAHTATRAIRMPVGALARVQRIGYVVLGLQLAGFLMWSTILYRRFALTYDFAFYHQAWYLIAHGNLSPYITVNNRQVWQNDAEFAIWPLAPLYWLWPHDVLLLWVQDAAIVAAEALAFTWICEVVKDRCRERDAVWLAGGGLVLFAATPWTWWAVSFDFHMETVALPFAVLLARDLARGRRRAWAWLIPVLAGGAPSATYVAGIGLGGVLGSRRSRLSGAAMVLAGVGYPLFLVLIHAQKGGSVTAMYGYLANGAPPHSLANDGLTIGSLVAGIASHPAKVLMTLWSRRVDLMANLAPAGLLGLGSLTVLPLILVVLLADTLPFKIAFAEPLFQSLPIYVLLPVGTVMVLAWLVRCHRRTAMVVTTLMVAQALGWAAVWAPRTSSQWLRVSAPAAATLAEIEARIPRSAEVIASQGVMGRFSGRDVVRPLLQPGRLRLAGGDTWFVIAPLVGIESLSPASQEALIGELAGPLHATLVTHANGVWAFRWHPPPGTRSMIVPDEATPLPAWAVSLASGTVGRSVMSGQASNWRVTSVGGTGYVVDGLAWLEPPGRYQAMVGLSADGPVNVEVWNDTGNVLLARQSIPATAGVESVMLPVDATTPYRARAYSGLGPFRADFVAPPPGERLEVRVWSPGGHRVNVYSAQLTPAGNGNASKAHSLTGKP